jgi:hypothetical protein
MDEGFGLERLGALAGTWHTTGEVVATTDTPATPFTATDSYDWLPGRHFLVHHWDAAMPDGRSQGIEIIGYDAERDRFPMHAYDNDGNVTEMDGSSDGSSLQFEGSGVRFVGTFNDQRSVVSGTWELQTDELAWLPWMRVTLTRQE